MNLAAKLNQQVEAEEKEREMFRSNAMLKVNIKEEREKSLVVSATQSKKKSKAFKPKHLNNVPLALFEKQNEYKELVKQCNALSDEEYQIEDMSSIFIEAYAELIEMKIKEHQKLLNNLKNQ